MPEATPAAAPSPAATANTPAPAASSTPASPKAAPAAGKAAAPTAPSSPAEASVTGPSEPAKPDIDAAFAALQRKQKGYAAQVEAFKREREEYTKARAADSAYLEFARSFESDPAAAVVQYAERTGKPVTDIVRGLYEGMSKYGTPEEKIAKLEARLEADAKARQEADQRAAAERESAQIQAIGQQFLSFVRQAVDAYPDLSDYGDEADIVAGFRAEAEAHYREHGKLLPWPEIARRLDGKLRMHYDAVEAQRAKRRGAATPADASGPANTGSTKRATGAGSGPAKPEGGTPPKTLTPRMTGERATNAPSAAESRQDKLRRLAKGLRFRA